MDLQSNEWRSEVILTCRSAKAEIKDLNPKVLSSMAVRRASSTFFNNLNLLNSTIRQSLHNTVAAHRNFSSGTFSFSQLSVWLPRKPTKCRERIEMNYLARWRGGVTLWFMKKMKGENGNWKFESFFVFVCIENEGNEILIFVPNCCINVIWRIWNPCFCLIAVKMENKIWNFNIIVVIKALLN